MGPIQKINLLSVSVHGPELTMHTAQSVNDSRVQIYVQNIFLMKYEVQLDFSGFTGQWDLIQQHCLRSVLK